MSVARPAGTLEGEPVVEVMCTTAMTLGEFRGKVAAANAALAAKKSALLSEECAGPSSS